MQRESSSPEGPNPSGLCMCGCGRPVALAKQTIRARGLVRGKPVRFIPGHNIGPPAPDLEPPNPSGLCMCGCGERAPLAFQTDRRRGNVSGEPMRFIRGHYARTRKPEPLEQRLWDKATRTPDGCWLYAGPIMSNGYGLVSIGHAEKRSAHRLSWELANGPIPEGMAVCHRCDVRACIRPDHLFLGTLGDNNRDMFNKGRGYTPETRRGEANSKAKLTEAQVREIRRRAANGEVPAHMACEFGVGRHTVANIVRRKTWKHID